jgi:hypothetical protein
MESNRETTTFTDSIVFDIIKEFGERAKKGYDKYGTDMDRTDLSVADWCQHLREELMDGLVYLTRLKKDIISLEEEIKVHREEANRMSDMKSRYTLTWSPKKEDLTLTGTRNGTGIVYKGISKPNDTYTDEEPIIRKRYGFHR